MLMELTLERIRCTKAYTVSTLYNSDGKKVFVLDVVEPPVAGLSTSRLKALDPGKYKLFLKPNGDRTAIVPVFQSVAQRERFAFARMTKDLRMEGISFHSDNGVSKALLQCGRLKNSVLTSDTDDFDKLMISLIIAKQEKQPIWVNVK